MGQKVRPIGFRTGIMLGWKSNWCASKRDFPELLVEDQKIRKHINTKFKNAGISKVIIDRTREKVVVRIFAGKVGLIIGKKGAEVDTLTKELEDLFHRLIEVKTFEVSNPLCDAQLVSQAIAEEIEKRGSFRRTLKKGLEQSMDAGAKGVRIQMSGRLGGAEMARCETGMKGSIPLTTLRAMIDYGFTEAMTPQGHIGIKVWINNGDFLAEESKNGTNAQTSKVSKKPALDGGWLSAEVIEAGRITASHATRGEGKLFIRVFPHKSVTSIPLETRMGKGKGEPEFWAAVVKPGMLLYELGGVPEAAARDALAKVAYKMPFRCRFVTRLPAVG